MGPTLGELILYRLDAGDAASIRARRKAANGIRHGGPVRQGDVVAMAVTAINDDRVNGQALLDGDDSLWVCDAEPGDGPGCWTTR